VNFSQEIELIKSNLEKEILETQCEILEYFQEVPSIISVKTYIDSILFNLISNAIKYRSPDRTLSIAVRTFIVDDYVCLEVQDNGLGFDLTKYGKDVFSLYKRFHTHTEGKGLGLYLVKMQVLALGGKVEVISVPDQGSTFRTYFKKH
jgi:signal transduction histidine kinase